MKNPFARMLAFRQKQNTAEATVVFAETYSNEQLAVAVDQLQAEVQSLKKQLQAMSQKSVTRIGLVLAVPGVLSLVLSIVTESQPLAFIGLGLTFWGALFFLVRPVTYVRGSLVSITASTLYATIDRILDDLKCEGKGLYIPPYPKEMYLPEHLKGLKETIVFVSADADSSPPSIEQMASGKFMTKKPKGICLIAPGASLLDLIEKMLKIDIAKVSLENLSGSLPQVILENFQLAKEIEIKIENKYVYFKTTDSIYKNLYGPEGPKSAILLGDPLTSAVASAVAKATGKQVSIQSLDFSPDSQILQVSFELREG